MKITPAFFAALFISTLAAQEPVPAPTADPAKPQLRTTPPSPIAPPPGLTSEPLPLIPETPENTQKPSGSAIAQPKRDKTSDAENELAAHLRLRELRNQALKDPKIQAEWAKAHATKTDAERRTLLVNYYNMLYGKMAKMDGSMGKRIGVMQNIAVRRLMQHNLAASESIEPAEAIVSDYDERSR